MTKFPTDKLVALITLGCDKNRVDAEKLIYDLKNNGFKFTNVLENANIIIVNTCAFIKPAQEESIETILRIEQLKNDKLEKLIVTGCLSQRNGDELEKEIPLVDRFVKLDNNKNLAKIIYELYGIPYNAPILHCGVLNREVSTPKHYAYVKIAEGCDNFCTYCTIPHIRGRFFSRPIDEIISECKELVHNGATELILVAQDVTRYGQDFSIKSSITQLAQEITKIDGLKWLRLHYCYPELITDELLHEIDNNSKICKYIDIPLQHIDDTILKKMNRKGNYSSICNLMDKIKNLNNKIAIRSSFIVGFPFETDESQQLLKDFLCKYKLDNVGFFIYSKEEGTVSYNFENQVAEKIKKLRQKELYQLQKNIAKNNNEQKIGAIIEGVCENFDKKTSTYTFRNQYNSPEVDSLMYVTTEKKLEIGKYYNLKIVDFCDYDLICYICE